MLLPHGWGHDLRVTVHQGVIAAIEPCDASATEVDVLAPGFVDLQVNGVDDVDVASARDAAWDRLDALVLAQGVTTWFPTLVTMPLEAYAAPLARIAAAIDRPAPATPRPDNAGAHLEGPFLGAAHGAHRDELVRPVDLAWLRELPQHVRMVTLGAEQPEAAAATRLLVERGVLVSLGHTKATDAQLTQTATAGAAMVTHLFNAMTGLHHREPGVAAWALTHSTMAASIIADGVHVHPHMIDLAFRLLGPRRAILVTDAVAWRSGRVGPIGMEMRDGAPRLPDGTLAGSALAMDRAVANCIAAGVDTELVLRAASTNPARLAGLADRGTIEVGRRADLVALDEQFAVQQVWVAGRATQRA